jgi:hypothetical protein
MAANDKSHPLGAVREQASSPTRRYAGTVRKPSPKSLVHLTFTVFVVVITLPDQHPHMKRRSSLPHSRVAIPKLAGCAQDRPLRCCGRSTHTSQRGSRCVPARSDVHSFRCANRTRTRSTSEKSVTRALSQSAAPTPARALLQTAGTCRGAFAQAVTPCLHERSWRQFATIRLD